MIDLNMYPIWYLKNKEKDFIIEGTKMPALYTVGSLDMDGIISQGMTSNFFSNCFKCNVIDIAQVRKKHGFSEEVRERLAAVHNSFIVATDCGSAEDDKEFIIQLLINNNRVLVIDHHPEDSTIEHPNYLRIYSSIFTGASLSFLVYENFKQFDKWILSDYYRFLAALASKADMANFTKNELLAFTYRAVKDMGDISIPLLEKFHPKNKIRFNIEDYIYGGMIPMINAVARSIKPELIEELIDAVAMNPSFFARNKVANYVDDLYKRILRNKQNNKRIVENYTRGTFEEYEKFCLCYVDKLHRSCQGLIANSIASSTGKPTISMHETEGMFHGSMRGHQSIFNSFKQVLRDAGATVAGHDNAAGVFFDIDLLNDIKKKINATESNVDGSKEYISFNELTKIYPREKAMIKYYLLGYPKKNYFLKNLEVDDWTYNKGNAGFKIGDYWYYKPFTKKVDYEQIYMFKDIKEANFVINLNSENFMINSLEIK